MKTVKILILSAAVVLMGSASWASPKHLQAYKKAYPDAKVKCITCHVKEKATKTDHELNAYGVKAKELGDPSQENYQKLGSVEDFEKTQAAAAENAK